MPLIEDIRFAELHDGHLIAELENAAKSKGMQFSEYVEDLLRKCHEAGLIKNSTPLDMEGWGGNGHARR